MNWWCHLTISSPVTLFSFFLQSFLASGSFSSELAVHSGGRTIGASTSASVLLKGIQGWFPCFQRDSWESSSAPQFEGINSLALCLLYGPALTTVPDHWEDYSLDYMDLCWQNNLGVNEESESGLRTWLWETLVPTHPAYFSLLSLAALSWRLGYGLCSWKALFPTSSFWHLHIVW